MNTDTQNGTRECASGKDVHLDEAMTLAGYGKFHYLLLLGSAFIIFAHMLENFSTGFLVPAAQCDFQMTPQQKGLLNSITSIGLISSSHFWGFIADTRGRRLSLLITLFMDFVCAAGSSFAPDYDTFIAIRYFNGFFICGPSTIIFAYVGEFHTPSTRSKSIIFLNLMAGIAGLFIPVLAWLIIPQTWSIPLISFNYTSWRIFVLICGTPSFIAFLFLLFFLPETPKYYLSQGRSKEALNILGSMYAINKWDSAENFQVKALKVDEFEENTSRSVRSSKSILNLPKSVWDQTAPLFKRGLVYYTLLICLIQFGLFFCFNSISLWMPDIFNALAQYSTSNQEHDLTTCDIVSASYNVNSESARDAYNSTTSTNFTLVTDSEMANECVTNIDPSAFENTFIIGSASAVESLIAVLIVNYVGKKWMLLGLLLTSGCCGIGLAFTTTSTQVLILVLFFETFSGLSTVIISSIVVDIYPTYLRAMAVCLSLMVGRIGIILGSTLIGNLIAFNCSIVFIVMGSIVIAACILSQLLPA